jgi:hypothetical protein
MWRTERRLAKGIRLLEEALRLQAEGDHDAAEAAYQQGVRLTRRKE